MGAEAYDIPEVEENRHLQEEKGWEDIFKLKPLKDWFSPSLSLTPLVLKPEEIAEQRKVMSFGLRISPMEHFFISGEVLLNLNKERNIYYQPDYYYTFGYEDYTTDTSWGFSYENYQNNRFHPSGDPYASSFMDGRWTLSYKSRIENVYYRTKVAYEPSEENWIFGFKTTVKLTDKTRFTLDMERYLQGPHTRGIVSAHHKIYKKLFVEGGIHLYSNLEHREDYESDYYYTIGWRDYRKGHFSVIFSNQYMPTRFGWMEQPDIPFSDAQLTVSYNF
jgi:hypothetical protein